MISDSPCLCGDEERECKPTTRLSVLLPDLRGVGSWLVSSTGWNAAAELAGAADLLARATAQGVLIPARLRLEQRVDVKAGQTRRYAVPVIDVDVSFRDLLGGGMSQIGAATGANNDAPAVTANYTPLIPAAPGPTLGEALQEVEARQITRTSRSSAPLPTVETPFQPAPVPDDDVPFGDGPPAEPIPGQETLAVESEGKKSTPKDALNVVYNILQRDGHVTAQQMYAATATMRNIDMDLMVDLIDGRKQNGDLSWAKLRDSLAGDEIANLLDRLTTLQNNVGGSA